MASERIERFFKTFEIYSRLLFLVEVTMSVSNFLNFAGVSRRHLSISEEFQLPAKFSFWIFSTFLEDNKATIADLLRLHADKLS